MSEKTEFAQRLRKLRGGIPQSVLSELCGLDRNSIRRYEEGQIYPGWESIKKIADYFNVSIDYLMGKINS